jgi:hypothetical protein
MKRLLILLALLLPAQARAADDPIMFRPVSSMVLTGLTNIHPATGTAFNSYVRYIRALCTVNCLMAVVSTPIVAGSSRPVYLPGGLPEYFVVTPGQHVLVRTDTASGVLYINELDR